MTSAEIANLRIAAQKIGANQFKKPTEVVAHLGAMQAQDFAMVRWAVGLRMADATEAQVFEAYNRGDIIRTHVLRPTWHLMVNEDVDWMIRLTAPQILGSMPGRHKQLKLSEAVFQKSNRVIEKAVAAGPLVRDEVIAALKKAKVTGVPEIYSHILFRAELDRLICSGPMRGINPTYAAYTDRIKKIPVLKRDEALTLLAERYFTGHGPATLGDFVWWSGLKIGDARAAFTAVEKQFAKEKIGDTIYLMPKGIRPAPDGIYLLPAFDEFIIGYTDRSAVIPKSISPKVVSNNGIFWPTIVTGGQVCGTWKRKIRKGKLDFEAEYFGKVNATFKKAVDARVAELAAFF